MAEPPDVEGAPGGGPGTAHEELPAGQLHDAVMRGDQKTVGALIAARSDESEATKLVSDATAPHFCLLRAAQRVRRPAAVHSR
jgi:hypothetical protein|eukprot:COSAG01_NODE_524_length_15931_cov_72.340491_5_plen_83_part_00